jgi:hypothetical protein
MVNADNLNELQADIPELPAAPGTESQGPDASESTPPDPPEIQPAGENKPEAAATKRRTTRTTVFYPEESAIDTVVQARVDAGITRDYSHFLRQCVDFAINSGFVPGATFATGLQEPAPLKDAFFTKYK